MFGPDHFGRDGRALGDDAFLFQPNPRSLWVVTADTGAEGVHYRLDWVSPERALRKVLLSNLSDINAMGGRARHAFLNLGARREWGEAVFVELGRVLRELEAEFFFRVSGGDTIRTAGESFFAFTVLGEVSGSPLLRSGAKPGHKVFVSGALGGSAAGLHLLKMGERPDAGEEPTKTLIRAHFDPTPPLTLGPALAALGKPIGAIDISDGLSSELWHLSRQSGCAFYVEWSKLPVHDSLREWNEPQAIRDFILNGGEEYQLLFTGDFSDYELEALRQIVSIAEIGKVEAGEGVFMKDNNGRTEPLPAGGFSHA